MPEPAWLTEIEQRAATLRERDDGLALAALLYDDVPRLLRVARATEVLLECDPTHSQACREMDRCVFCLGDTVGGLFHQRVEHKPGCPWAALREALGGEQP